MGSTKERPPSPPDPRQTAAAQTGTNVATAIAQQQLQNIGQITPAGQLEFQQTGTFQFTDPTTGETFDIPQTTAIQTLTPAGQQIFETGQATQQNLADIARQQSEFFEERLATPFEGSSEEVEGRLFELGRQRLDPVFNERRAALEQDLANRGIGIGSPAYNTAIRQFEEARNDAFNQLALRGRGQAFQEALAVRSQPIQELSALLGQTQVQQPQFITAQQPQLPTVDFAGIEAQNFAQRQRQFEQERAARQNLFGGLFGLGAAFI